MSESTKLVVDLQPMAQMLELKFADQLKEPPKGIYSALRVEPVLVDGRRYFTRPEPDADDKKKGVVLPLVEVTDINTVETAVYSEDGKILLSASTMRNRGRMLSNKPILPYRGIYIAKAMFDQRIDETIAWRRSRSNHIQRIYNQLQDGVFTSDEELSFELADFELDYVADVGDLVKGHEWNVYTTQHRDTKLTIERGEDYRILEWTRLFEEGKVKL